MEHYFHNLNSIFIKNRYTLEHNTPGIHTADTLVSYNAILLHNITYNTFIMESITNRKYLSDVLYVDDYVDAINILHIIIIIMPSQFYSLPTLYW